MSHSLPFFVTWSIYSLKCHLIFEALQTLLGRDRSFPLCIPLAFNVSMIDLIALHYNYCLPLLDCKYIVFVWSFVPKQCLVTHSSPSCIYLLRELMNE